ncbi:MAG: TorF family putative porin [Pseudomonadota bacterium]
MFTRVISILVSSVMVSSLFADESISKPQSAWTGNIGVTSQYLFRGLTQTNGKPALQGGIDYSHPTGFYAGSWLSNISWYTEQNAGTVSVPAALSAPGSAGAPYASSKSNSTSLELDIYGGFKKSLPNDWSYDLGVIHYAYPGTYENLGAYKKPNTTEVYGAIGYKWINAKYSKAISAYTFGANESKGASYIDISMNAPILDSGFNVQGHVGRQHYPANANQGYWGASGGNNSDYSYTDYKLGITKEYFGATFGVAWTYANTKATGPDGETTAYNNAFGKNIGGNRIAVSVNKSF